MFVLQESGEKNCILLNDKEIMCCLEIILLNKELRRGKSAFVYKNVYDKNVNICEMVLEISRFARWLTESS